MLEAPHKYGTPEIKTVWDLGWVRHKDHGTQQRNRLMQMQSADFHKGMAAFRGQRIVFPLSGAETAGHLIQN